MKITSFAIFVLLAAGLVQALAFTKAPSIAKATDSTWLIEFTVDESTDVEISIIDPGTEKVVRHLAAGALGSNAPAPLLKDVLAQSVAWNGRDDYRNAVTAPENMVVRVRAGMSVVMDNSVGSDPYEYAPSDPAPGFGSLIKNSDGTVYLMFKPSGVVSNMVRQYSATGEYIKTIFPIPGTKGAASYTGWGLNLLSDNEFSPKTQDYYGPLMTNSPLGYFDNPVFVAIQEPGKIALTDNNSNLLWVFNEDGTCDAATASLTTSFLKSPGIPGGLRWGTRGPKYIATSPDRSFFLLSGFAGADTSFWRDGRLFKVDLATREATILFDLDTVVPAASRNAALLNEYRTELSGVTFGDSGYVFVCDRLFNRLLVLDSVGRLVKSFPVKTPDNVAYHAGSGVIYVNSVNRYDGLFLLKIADWRKDTAFTVTQLIKKGDGDYGTFGYCDAGSTNQFYLTITEDAGAPVIWLAGRIGGIVLYKDSSDTFVEYRNFRKLSKQAFSTIKRLAVDPLTETAYTVGSGTTIFKVSDWANPAFIPCSTETQRRLDGYDLAIDPLRRLLYVRQIGGIGPFEGDINRFSMGNYYAPAPLTTLASNLIVDSFCVPGTMSVGTADYGMAVAPNGHLAAMSVHNYISLAPECVRYHPVSDTETARRQLIVVPDMPGGKAAGGGVKFDFQGNLYVGQRPATLTAGLPAVITSDYSWNRTMGHIYRYNAQGPLDGDLFTAGAVAPDRIYGVDLGQFGNMFYNAGGCACMTATFGIDGWGRLYAPNGPFQKITVIDNEGNRVARFGSYGNNDDVLDELGGKAGTYGRCAMAYPFCVEATDNYIYATDPGNMSLVRFKKVFALDNRPNTAAEAHTVKPGALSLSAYPNPFTAQGRVSVSLPRSGRLSLVVTDLSGRQVRALAAGSFGTGLHAFQWDGMADNGKPAAAGIYFFRLRSDAGNLIKRMVLAR